MRNVVGEAPTRAGSGSSSLEGVSGTGKGRTDARGGEYSTYAPSGEVCPGCSVAIGSLELCRRVSGPDAGARGRYWHPGCVRGDA